MTEGFARFGRHALRTAALALAGGTFLVGLLAPLTPSEGQPRLVHVLLFAGIPILLSLGVALSSGNRGWRLAGAVLAAAIVAATIWLFAAVL